MIEGYELWILETYWSLNSFLKIPFVIWFFFSCLQLVDDVDLRAYNLQFIRRQISVVSQEPVLFDCSIAENITYGLESPELVPMDDIVSAAKKANIHDFITTLQQVRYSLENYLRRMLPFSVIFGFEFKPYSYENHLFSRRKTLYILRISWYIYMFPCNICPNAHRHTFDLRWPLRASLYIWLCRFIVSLVFVFVVFSSFHLLSCIIYRDMTQELATKGRSCREDRNKGLQSPGRW